ncbi:hypothetical protein P154DRAFT_521479 [Amniculicola lignicola CBS 123094]|uniref:Uncharacterized protein n=1 Tax=Amniculicola lignicola CBS 123094 TaxID=1392246 RepID=A0A6A5WJ69_9PLEO|nr:hypothetical protein P154DRAFT_521479 [Amniculicola lignicola CBS 123094]
MPAQQATRPPSKHHNGASPGRRLHQRTKTAPTPTLVLDAADAPRRRRLTGPSTPTLTPSLSTPSQVSSSSATSPSYFSPQTATSGKDARSPATPRRPPASFSGLGIDNSRGPPIALLTRGTIDLAAHRSQSSQKKPADFAFAQQQLLTSGLVSPGTAPPSTRSASRQKERKADKEAEEPPPRTSTRNRSRESASRSSRRPPPMASSIDDSSEYDSGLRSHSEDARAPRNGYGPGSNSTDGEPTEDLFLNIAEDTAPRESAGDAASRADRLRSRIARVNNRQSLPTNAFSSNPSTPNASRRTSVVETKPSTPYRRASLLVPTSRTQREQSPLSPSLQETPRSRLLDLSPKPSLPSPRMRDQDLSPHQFLSTVGRRRPSNNEPVHTPPNRAYRPSNLHYSSSRDHPEPPVIDTPQQETGSRPDGTESLDDSTGPAASVWDELDDLKSRIRKIELGGKIPSTSGAVVSNASGDRPRTANTSATTVSTSPQHLRKTSTEREETPNGVHAPNKMHPLLKDALGKAKQHIAPAVHRVLETTVNEAIELAELTGSSGPQGTLFSASSIINGAAISDRHVRRKADNICRNLTDLCLALCEAQPAMASPALARAVVASNSRRPSVQINGQSPLIRQTIEQENDALRNSSPSRALSRIEARRTSMGGISGSPRDHSQEPPNPSQSHIPSRLARAGTSLHRTRRTLDEDEEDPTMRVPSRAMTDFQNVRTEREPPARHNRGYPSREPLPELQPSPAIHHTQSLRRPTVSGATNDNSHLHFRDTARRYQLDRQNSPAYERQMSAELSSRDPRTQYNSSRTPLSSSGLGRMGSLNRRLRGNGTGE